MNFKTKYFLKSKFQEYYKTAEIHIPSRLEAREWGFISFDEMPETVMRRHKSFGSRGEVEEYLAGMAPAHAYHSVAYYTYPSAPTMKEKQWQEADLIFDLDADHIPGAPNSYSEMLDHVKKETLKLYDLLINDFGFNEDDIRAVFSGGRGYHFHISDPRVRSLGSAERREIVDYISGRGLNIEKIFYKKAVSGDAGSENARMNMLSPESEGGWGGRINRYLVSYLTDLASKEDAEELFSGFKGIGKKTAQKMIDILRDEAQVELLRRGNMEALSKVNKDIIQTLALQAVNDMSASVDEPVTGDIKRLIRLGGSLHGKSGMRVTTLSISELEKFEPLTDAVVFSDKPVKLKVIRPFAVQMKGNDLYVEEGTQELPEYAAVYLMCRGAAEYGS
ncbi:DNA primase catalytic subunit PriS [Methanococcoides orientis]|uniref:DNA primase catalytic subunit PriS n=1 Tax=Methanococcoides orientis TaxID=2822137 RepID=UPI001E358757|nr:DNA primase catalytic subunit PriS [Methanococcoides orientis]UGV40112.1 DNA primase catalytic subunit PriS [Methanococcoides orientis]